MYFQIHAPYKDFIYLIGDFNNWVAMPDYELFKTPDGKHFWIEITGLDKNIEYGFQYMIDFEQMRVGDPYCEKILDPWNDKYIPDATYPNLKPYPVGKTADIVGVFQTKEADYNWSNNSYDKPAKEELIVYELLIRDFHEDHNYNAVIEKLDYLQDLGVNAIELMPIMEFEGNESWGYNPSFMFAPDKYYGPKNELKRFVDSCHSRNIAVILDIALNHSFGQSPMVRMYFDPNAGQWGQPTAQSPWFNEEPKHDFNVGYDFNHESSATKLYSKRVFNHWIEEYKIDGYRLDLSKGFTQKNTLGNVGAWGAYDQGRINILKDYAQEMWNTDSTTFVILEHFADNSEETVLSGDGQMIWGNNNHQYIEAAMGYKSDLRGVSHQSRGWSDMHLVSYMESHDEERMIYKTEQFGNHNSNYNTRVLDTALQRTALSSAFFYTVPGPKMLWQFGELGYDYSINHCPDGSIDPDCRVANKPIRWDYLADQKRKDLYAIVSELNFLRANNPVFRQDKNHDLSVTQFTKRIKLQDTALQVVVIGNFGISSANIDPSFHQTGTWYEHFTRDTLYINNVSDPILLEPGEWKLYTSKALQTAIGIEDLRNAYNNTIFSKTYPNPFQNEVNFIHHQTIESLGIFDLQGRGILQTQPKTDVFKWNGLDQNGHSIAPGMYFYVLESKGNTTTGKLIKQ